MSSSKLLQSAKNIDWNQLKQDYILWSEDKVTAFLGQRFSQNIAKSWMVLDITTGWKKERNLYRANYFKNFEIPTDTLRALSIWLDNFVLWYSIYLNSLWEKLIHKWINRREELSVSEFDTIHKIVTGLLGNHITIRPLEQEDPMDANKRLQEIMDAVERTKKTRESHKLQKQ